MDEAVVKKIYTAHDVFDAHVLRGVLEAEGIDAVVRGGPKSPVSGLYVREWPTVWVREDDRFQRAQEIAADYSQPRAKPDAEATSTWQCPGCGERLEQQFTECWNCGGTRPVNQGG